MPRRGGRGRRGHHGHHGVHHHHVGIHHRRRGGGGARMVPLPMPTPTHVPMPRANRALLAPGLPMYCMGLLTAEEYGAVVTRLNVPIQAAMSEGQTLMCWIFLPICGICVLIAKAKALGERLRRDAQAILDEENGKLEKSGRALRYMIANPGANNSYIYVQITPQEAAISEAYRARMAAQSGMPVIPNVPAGMTMAPVAVAATGAVTVGGYPTPGAAMNPPVGAVTAQPVAAGGYPVASAVPAAGPAHTKESAAAPGAGAYPTAPPAASAPPAAATRPVTGTDGIAMVAYAPQVAQQPGTDGKGGTGNTMDGKNYGGSIL